MPVWEDGNWQDECGRFFFGGGPILEPLQMGMEAKPFELGSSTLHASLAMRAEASLSFIQVEWAARNVTLVVGQLQLMSNHHLEKAG